MGRGWVVWLGRARMFLGGEGWGRRRRRRRMNGMREGLDWVKGISEGVLEARDILGGGTKKMWIGTWEKSADDGVTRIGAYDVKSTCTTGDDGSTAASKKTSFVYTRAWTATTAALK